MSYIMYDILKPSNHLCLGKFGVGGQLTSFLERREGAQMALILVGTVLNLEEHSLSLNIVSCASIQKI